jgi:hypothetical protein
MNTLPLTVLGDNHSVPLQFPVRRVINAGYVGRDRQAVQAHIDELQREGIPPPSAVPMLFPLTAENLTTQDRIEVISGETSGEVEYVLLLGAGEVFVGVGSDHTDRALERQSLIKSKQICRNVLSSQVWRYPDVQAHWDDLVLQSWVKGHGADNEVLYQRAPLRSILSAEDLMALVRSRLRDREGEGMVIFSGTIPILTAGMCYGDYFRGELIDPHSGGRLTCTYWVVRLDYLEGVAE